MKLVTIVGARPQFIKAAMVSRAILRHNSLVNNKDKIKEVIVHTGQHYDDNMSKVFFKELEIPQPKYNLGVGSSTHGKQTGRMLEKIEEALLKERPDYMLVYGDTNSTLAGALAASKLHIPVAHIEAGLRSFNMRMPEEVNRVMTDHVSTLLFCPTKTAVNNLKKEGIAKGVFNVGDVMYDSVLYNIMKAEKKSSILKELNIHTKTYLLSTLHRQENTDNPKRLISILSTLSSLDYPVIIPIHPRTRKVIEECNFSFKKLNNLKIVPPVSYLDMLVLEKNAKLILTDSGGVQKEAYFLRVPCITLRDETEWIETVESGWNTITGVNPEKIRDAIYADHPGSIQKCSGLYGDSNASEQIIEILQKKP